LDVGRDKKKKSEYKILFSRVSLLLPLFLFSFYKKNKTKKKMRSTSSAIPLLFLSISFYKATRAIERATSSRKREGG
jgi:hypothetical protein